jgi:hypothetical protein
MHETLDLCSPAMAAGFPASSIAAAIEESDLLAFVVDVAGMISGQAGGFRPMTARAGTLLEALGPEVFETPLMDAFIGAMALEETTTADFVFGGVSCHALCCPLPGDEVRAFVLIAPRYAHTQTATLDQQPTSSAEGPDLREVLAGWRDPLATMGAGNELFVWTDNAPLPVALPREVILRILDGMLEAPLAAHEAGGTAVLTARPLLLDPDGCVELRMRTYATSIPDSVIRALEAVYAELGASCSLPIVVESDARSLDVVAHIPTRPGAHRTGLPPSTHMVVADTDRALPLAQ